MREGKYKAVVVDDEPVCIENLKKSLVAYPEVLLAGEARTAAEGSLLILNEQPDLLFLDVELPGMSGVELLQDLQHRISWDMRVVFYTSHQKYWLDALRQSAFDYLLKPYLPDEFATIIPLDKDWNHDNYGPLYGACQTRGAYKEFRVCTLGAAAFTANLCGAQYHRLSGYPGSSGGFLCLPAG